MSTMTTKERERRRAAEAAERHRTSIHEAGHAVVGRALGFDIDEVSLNGGAGGGVCHAELPPLATLDNIKRELCFVLAGRLAVAIERQEEWQRLSPSNTIGLESHAFGTGYPDYVKAVSALLGGDELAGYHWLDKELPAAADEAVRILREHWGEVLGLASRLRAKGTVDLGESVRRTRVEKEIERMELEVARDRAKSASSSKVGRGGGSR